MESSSSTIFSLQATQLSACSNYVKPTSPTSRVNYLQGSRLTNHRHLAKIYNARFASGKKLYTNGSGYGARSISSGTIWKWKKQNFAASASDQFSANSRLYGRDQKSCLRAGTNTFGFGEGIHRDIQRRLPHYLSDFNDALHHKSVGSVFSLYLACLTPCIAFGYLFSYVTASQIGVVEAIVGTAGAGFLYAAASGQPLTLLGPTGLMIGLVYNFAQQLGLPFLPIYGWVGIFTGCSLAILAAIQASDMMKYFTRFTDEIYSALISLELMHEGIKNLWHMFKQYNGFLMELPFLSLMLATATWMFASLFAQLRNSRFLNLWGLRNAISDFDSPLAIFIMSCVYQIFLSSVKLPKLFIPSTFSTTSGRPWLVPLFSIPLWGIAASLVPAALFSLVMFLDLNMTTRLVNNPGHKLLKGEGYHLDLFVFGLITGILSAFGLPWMLSARGHSLRHVRGLATTSKSICTSEDSNEDHEEEIVAVQENRLTGILIHVCIGATLLLLPVLRLLPTPIIDGFIFYMGVNNLTGNQFFERLKLWFFEPTLYPQQNFIKGIPTSTLHGFTTLQVACLVTLWTLKSGPWGITFPLLILVFLPIRNYIAGSFMAPQYLNVIDTI